MAPVKCQTDTFNSNSSFYLYICCVCSMLLHSTSINLDCIPSTATVSGGSVPCSKAAQWPLFSERRVTHWHNAEMTRCQSKMLELYISRVSYHIIHFYSRHQRDVVQITLHVYEQSLLIGRRRAWWWSGETPAEQQDTGPAAFCCDQYSCNKKGRRDSSQPCLWQQNRVF